MSAIARAARATPLAVLVIMAVGCGQSPVAAAVRAPTSASSVPRLMTAASWTHPSEGYRLHVTPTRAGRNRAADRPHRALNQAIRVASSVPFTMTSTIHRSLLNQLRCHAVYAPNKPHWNLEAWRPDVGYTGTVAALCNP